MLKRMENQMEQLETALAGALERITSIESQLVDYDAGKLKKPVVYVDEDTCLMSSDDADIEFIKSKLEHQ